MPQFKLSRRYFSNRIMKTCSRRASYGQQKSLPGHEPKTIPVVITTKIKENVCGKSLLELL